MLHRIKKKNDIHCGKWNGLGGKMNPGETPEDCIIREVYEESGLTIRSPKLKGHLTFPKFAQNEDWYVFVFIASQFTGELIDSSEGHLEWINDQEISNLNLWEGDFLFLEWLKDHRFFSGKLVYENGTLIDHHVCFHSCS